MGSTSLPSHAHVSKFISYLALEKWVVVFLQKLHLMESLPFLICCPKKIWALAPPLYYWRQSWQAFDWNSVFATCSWENEKVGAALTNRKHNIILFVCPSKILNKNCFYFPFEKKYDPQEKLETMLTQNFGGTKSVGNCIFHFG